MVEEKHSHEDLFKKKPGEKRLVIIDGNHLIHRAFYAIQAPLKTSAGEPTNALYGFVGMLINILEQEKPDYLAVTFDEHAPTFRHEVHEGYKATRTKAPDDLYAQIPRIKEMAHRFKAPVFSLAGYEADDLMGTLSAQAKAKGVTTFLVTGDMDALQLVDEATFVVFPHKGYREPLLYDRGRVAEKYGVYPDQIIDYKALVGDTSDNIKGVDGIGPKGAEKLLKDYKTLENLYAHLTDLPEVVRLKLERNRDQAFFAKHLATIVRDVPANLDLEACRVSHLDFKGLASFLKEMEINSLARRLDKITPAEAKVSADQMSLF